MRTQTFYICDTCGSKFDNEAECRRHEITEHKRYDLMDDKELSYELKAVGANVKIAKFANPSDLTPDNSLVFLSGEALMRLMTEASDRLLAGDKGYVSDWIPVSDGYPNDEAVVLVCNAAGVIYMARRRIGGYWNIFPLSLIETSSIRNVFDHDTTYNRIVAWMPLPAPYGNPSFDSVDKEDVCRR